MLLDNYHSVDQFLMDVNFRKWVMEPGSKDVIFINDWILNHPEKKDLWETAAEIIKIVEFDKIEETDIQTEQQWQKIKGALFKDDEYHYNKKPPFLDSVLVNIYTNRYKYAAAIPIFLLVAFFFLFLQEKPYKYYVTNFGEKQKIELPDGSILALNANSNLKLNIDLKKGIREAWLEGEAFFEVHQIEENGKKVPFFVYVDNLKIEVLGTEFNVFSRKQKVQVVLESGAVAINNSENEPIKMEPGELVEYKDFILNRKLVDTELFSSWKENQWIFKDAPLSLIVIKIEEIYGIEIIIKDKELADEKMSGALPASSLKAILNGISRIYEINVIENKNEFLLEKIKSTF
jgi:ferric-dicitrate binding protein FerR (iron transport regulator)